jgi:CO/xanthine dehydrogenase Mo-binding subunit
MTVPAVIANAVSDALAPLGVHITELPMSPARLWELIEHARKGRGHGQA